MSAPPLNELRADGRMVVDAPRRKLAIYANVSGEVILLSVTDGIAHYFDVDSEEVTALLAAAARAGAEAREIRLHNDAQYEAYVAIENAKEGR